MPMSWSSLIPIGIVALLIVLNGLFVAAEFAIVGVSKAELARGLPDRRRAVRMARAILRNPQQQDRFIATAQLGITAASLGLGMYGEHMLAEWFAHHLESLGAGRWVAAHTIASVLAITVLTYFHIVIGEMVPKAVALQRARDTTLWIVPIMRVVQLAVYPLVIALNGLGNAVLRLFGVQRSASHESYRTPEEIAFIVQESQAGGLLRGEAADVMRELLEFSELTAGEVMVPRVRVSAVPLGATPDDLTALMRATPHTRYPVYDQTLDHILGALHLRDILQLLTTDAAVSADNIRPVPFVPATATVERVLAAMREHRVQLVVVMDEHGGTAGIVTLEDLFEEVVGDISERPGDVFDIHRDDAGRLVVDGNVRVTDVGEELDVTLEHEDVDTVSGLVLALLERPPVPGDCVEYDGVRFCVTSVREHGVGTCTVELASNPVR
jgi:CBS domain containing-hemolysin-like protein